MSTDLLADLATSIPVPGDAFGPARAYVEVVRDGPDHALYAACAHRYHYRLYFALDGGRRRSAPVGRSFQQPAQAIRLAKLLNAASEAGDGLSWAEPSSSRFCMACQGPLLAGSRPDRRTCSSACRQRLAREARAAEQGARVSEGQGHRKCDAGDRLAGARSARLRSPDTARGRTGVGVPGAARSEVRNAVATPTLTV